MSKAVNLLEVRENTGISYILLKRIYEKAVETAKNLEESPSRELIKETFEDLLNTFIDIKDQLSPKAEEVRNKYLEGKITYEELLIEYMSSDIGGIRDAQELVNWEDEEDLGDEIVKVPDNSGKLGPTYEAAGVEKKDKYAKTDPEEKEKEKEKDRAEKEKEKEEE